MMVTFCEAYIDDALRILIKNGLVTPNITKPTRRDRIKVWIGYFLNDGPREWIKEFTRYGVAGYRSGLADEMVTVWERRHAIIHDPTEQNLNAQPQDFSYCLSAIDHFVRTTDAFIVTLPS
jgi:hypothetical protein